MNHNTQDLHPSAKWLDKTREVVSRLDGALSTLTKAEMEAVMADLPTRPTGLIEQLLEWRLSTLHTQGFYEPNPIAV